jgi:hypothetical protein
MTNDAGGRFDITIFTPGYLGKLPADAQTQYGGWMVGLKIGKTTTDSLDSKND